MGTTTKRHGVMERVPDRVPDLDTIVATIAAEVGTSREFVGHVLENPDSDQWWCRGTMGYEVAQMWRLVKALGYV